MKTTLVKVMAVMGLTAVTVACTQTMAADSGNTSSAMAMSKPAKAAGLKSTLNTLFQEHVYLAAAATGAALGGREAEFKAAAGALDQNSVAISRAIGTVYGQDAEQAFLPLWRKHIGFAVDYTVAVAGNDKAKQDRAVNDLIAYTKDFGAFFNAANPNLPSKVVADLVEHHVVTLKA
jgi:hypothetical protein